MRTTTASGAVYTFIAWLPLLVVLAATVWFLAFGVLHLEMNSFGTEYLVKNSETSNRPTGLTGGASSQAQIALYRATSE
ncbi:MAG: hypothetical protein JWN41_1004 [Thermoleophilia bacterium]|nr:hypothetical protein [Thermoleophilia bacterium]